MCRVSGHEQKPFFDLMEAVGKDIAAFKEKYPNWPLDGGELIDPADLRATANNCPACMLLAIRKSSSHAYLVLGSQRGSVV